MFLFIFSQCNILSSTLGIILLSNWSYHFKISNSEYKMGCIKMMNYDFCFSIILACIADTFLCALGLCYMHILHIFPSFFVCVFNILRLSVQYPHYQYSWVVIAHIKFYAEGMHTLAGRKIQVLKCLTLGVELNIFYVLVHACIKVTCNAIVL
jgi:hypothetical protein